MSVPLFCLFEFFYISIKQITYKQTLQFQESKLANFVECLSFNLLILLFLMVNN